MMRPVINVFIAYLGLAGTHTVQAQPIKVLPSSLLRGFNHFFVIFAAPFAPSFRSAIFEGIKFLQYHVCGFFGPRIRLIQGAMELIFS